MGGVRAPKNWIFHNYILGNIHSERFLKSKKVYPNLCNFSLIHMLFRVKFVWVHQILEHKTLNGTLEKPLKSWNYKECSLWHWLFSCRLYASRLFAQTALVCIVCFCWTFPSSTNRPFFDFSAPAHFQLAKGSNQVFLWSTCLAQFPCC